MPASSLAEKTFAPRRVHSSGADVTSAPAVTRRAPLGGSL